ncbi:MAG: hypothetical protein PHX18_00985 [Candidatus Gastranaerophilales bacterium]|nr:hypothetical protein [Candidatus Gastranaerophilales bacterium]
MKKIFAVFLVLILNFYIALPGLAISETDNLQIQKKSHHLHSRLSKTYVGEVYKIKNSSSAPVTLETIALHDVVSGKAAYFSVRRTAIKQTMVVLGTGLALAIPTLFISAIISVIAVPFVVVGNFCGNRGADMEGARYSKNTELEEALVLQPGEVYEIKTLKARGTTPKLSVIYSVDGERYTIEKD